MAKKALEEHKYELIKAHILHPNDSPLSEDHQVQLNRILNIARLLDIQPIQSNAVALHMAKYPEIRRSQAYEDCNMAMRLFNTIHSFEYDFWQTWLMNDIVRNIDLCKASNDPRAWRVIAAEHANIIKALGEKPPKEIDPKLVEKHTFIIPIKINNKIYNFDQQKFLDLPSSVQKKVTDALITDISDIEAEEILNS